MALITLFAPNRYSENTTWLAEHYGAQTSTNFEMIDSSGVLRWGYLGNNFTYRYDGFFNGGVINSSYIFSSEGTLIFTATGLAWNVFDRNASLSVGTSRDNYFTTLMSGNDEITGSSGDDKIIGSRGNDTINGGAGIDVLSFKGFSTSVNANLSTGTVKNDYGTSFVVNVEDIEGSIYADVLIGNSSNNSFQGFGGNDTINGAAGFDTVSYLDARYAVTVNLSTGTVTGGSGNDTLTSIERIIGSRFNDTLIGSSANESFLGGFGNDSIDGGGGVDTVEYSGVGSGVTVNLTTGTASGGAGNDTLVSIENVKGSIFADLITGDSLANTLIGNAGNDVLNGMGGNDILRGGTGKDILDGGTGPDTADYSDKTTAVIATLNGATNATVSVGGVAEDTIRNIENLTGGSAADRLTGDSLANTLIGNAGNDVLNGMGGNDILRGGLGNDTLTGGTGQDIFHFDTTLNATTNIDRITDFSVVDDSIQLSRTIFSKLGTTTGVMDLTFFKSIATGGTTDSNDYIVYNKTTGALYYDANGNVNGLNDAVQFGALGTNLALINADFVLI